MQKRATTKPAAKGRPKTKSSHASRKPRKEQEPEYIEIMPPPHVQAYFDEMAQEQDSSDYSLWLEMLCELEQGPLKDVGLDARQRKFLWPKVGPQDLDQTARRIHQQYPDFSEERIKEFLIYWIQNGYEPKGYSDAQMDELESLTEQCADDVYPGKN